MSQPASRPRAFAPDLIRAVAIALVILLHLTGNARTTPDLDGVLGVTFHAISRVSVPLFVMLSGWLLLTAPVRSAGDFWRRRLPRTLWPLLGASAFFIFWRAWLYGDSWTVVSALKGFIAASIYYHLWYLYLILGLYLITPLLRTWYIHADTANRRLALLFWIGLLVVPPIIHRLTGPEWFLTGEMWLDYGGFYVLGAWLGAREPDASACRWAALALIGGLFVTVVGTWLVTLPGHPQSTLFHDYVRPNIALMSIGAFVLLQRLGRTAPPPTVAAPVRWIARYSLWIYLAHPVVLELCGTGRAGPWLQSLMQGGALSLLGATLFTLAVCAAAGSLVSRAGALLAPGSSPS
ncbi:MAG: acyltransferase family protein [Verrucomicrobia bacterium]|nr:acyltransferase family protein [Verrucomicrobiota bacterium]